MAGEALDFAKQRRCKGAIEPAKERVPTPQQQVIPGRKKVKGKSHQLGSEGAVQLAIYNSRKGYWEGQSIYEGELDHKERLYKLLQENGNQRAELGDHYKKKIDFLDGRIEKLTEQGASDRLIKELSSQQRALIAEFHRRVAPLVEQETELQEHTTGRKKEHRKLYHSVCSSCSLSLVSCSLVRISRRV